jgi:hypothetical protein
LEYSNARKLPPRLKWVGLPDFRDASLNAPSILLRAFLPLCTNLQILSIREEYRAENAPSHLSAHEFLCRFVDGIESCTPESVTALEFRLSVPFLDKLIEALGSRAKLNITRIGLDLGAWVQTYPIRHTSGELSDGQIASEVMHAAREACHKIYEEEHRKVLPAGSCWLLPESRRDSRLAAQLSPPGSADKVDETDVDDAKPGFEHDFYRDEGGSDPYNGLDRGWPYDQKKCANTERLHHKATMDYVAGTRVNTLPTMLVKLYDVSQVNRVKLYSLEPEWQAKSTNPIHPFALI